MYAFGIWGTDIISCLRSKYIMRLLPYIISPATIYHFILHGGYHEIDPI